MSTGRQVSGVGNGHYKHNEKEIANPGSSLMKTQAVGSERATDKDPVEFTDNHCNKKSFQSQSKT